MSFSSCFSQLVCLPLVIVLVALLRFFNFIIQLFNHSFSFLKTLFKILCLYLFSANLSNNSRRKRVLATSRFHWWNFTDLTHCIRSTNWWYLWWWQSSSLSLNLWDWIHHLRMFEILSHSFFRCSIYHEILRFCLWINWQYI